MNLVSSQILYEDNHLLVVNKPNGVLSQGDHTRDKTILDMGKSYIKLKYNKPGAVFLHPVSRLDRPVSGAIILARTSKALTRMNALIKNRQIKKTYTAVVSGIPKETEATLRHFLAKDPSTNTVKTVKSKHPKAKEAILSYSLSYTFSESSVLDIELQTGRPHQIRVQLSSIGHPIVGDGKYGYRSNKKLDFIYLHCRALHFEHPVKKEPVAIKAAYPNAQLWKQIR